MGYPQFPTHYPVPEPPRRFPVWLLVTGAAVAVVLLGLGGGLLGYRAVTAALAARTHHASPTPTPVPASSSAAPEPPPTDPSPTPQPVPTAVGLVNVTAVADQDQAVPVAEMFDSYFGGIDNDNPQQALAEYDPAGVVDPTDPTQASQFAQAVATTNDSAISLVGIGADPTGRGAMQARVLFTSRQAAGYGPPDAPNQTCTRWDITYILTDDASAGYRILDNARHSDAGC